MGKEEESVSDPAQLVLRLATKLANKLIALGYCRREANEKLLAIVHPILKAKPTHLKNTHKWLA